MSEISIIVPVYKVERYLRRCIDSILNQTFNDFDLILVDDGSPDSCGDICEKYAKTDNRITIIHRENGGLSAARNSGIKWALKNSDSEWITFVDSDDWLHPDYLKILLECAKKFNTEVSVCNFLRTFDNAVNSMLEKKLNVQKHSCKDFFINYNLNAVVAWGKLYKKYFFKDILYPEGRLHEDEFTTYKILFKCDFVCFVNEELYYYFINPAGITEGKEGKVWNEKKVYFISAMEERLIYFKKTKKLSLWEWQVKQYFRYIYSYLEYMNSEASSDEDKKYIKYLRKKLRFIIRNRNTREILNLSPKNNPEVYEWAYPRLMYLYWIVKK